jgi:PHD/YefM family antitoxin component YafN of YafNO toxin-antitoxin module
MDCFLITHCLWNEEKQIKIVSEIVKAAIEKEGSPFISQDQDHLNYNKLEDEFRSCTIELEGTIIRGGGNIDVRKPYKIGGKIYYHILNIKDMYDGKSFEYVDKEILDKLKIQNGMGNGYLRTNLVGQNGKMGSNLFIKKTRKNDYFISAKGDTAGYVINLEEYNSIEITVQKEPDIFAKIKTDDAIRHLLNEIEKSRIAQENNLASAKERLKPHLFVPAFSADVIIQGLSKGIERADELRNRILDFQDSYSKPKVQVNGN